MCKHRFWVQLLQIPLLCSSTLQTSCCNTNEKLQIWLWALETLKSLVQLPMWTNVVWFKECKDSLVLDNNHALWAGGGGGGGVLMPDFFPAQQRGFCTHHSTAGLPPLSGGIVINQKTLQYKFMHTLQRNLDLCLHRKGIARPQSQCPHSWFCERSTYSHVRSTYFSAAV